MGVLAVRVLDFSRDGLGDSQPSPLTLTIGHDILFSDGRFCVAHGQAKKADIMQLVLRSILCIIVSLCIMGMKHE